VRAAWPQRSCRGPPWLVGEVQGACGTAERIPTWWRAVRSTRGPPPPRARRWSPADRHAVPAPADETRSSSIVRRPTSDPNSWATESMSVRLLLQEGSLIRGRPRLGVDDLNPPPLLAHARRSQHTARRSPSSKARCRVESSIEHNPGAGDLRVCQAGGRRQPPPGEWSEESACAVPPRARCRWRHVSSLTRSTSAGLRSMRRERDPQENRHAFEHCPPAPRRRASVSLAYPPGGRPPPRGSARGDHNPNPLALSPQHKHAINAHSGCQVAFAQRRVRPALPRPRRRCRGA